MTKAELIELLEDFEGEDDINEAISDALRMMAEARAEMIECVEERQHASGMYAQQDLIDAYRRER